MTKHPAVSAAEFSRNFGRYQALAQRGAVPVTSEGHITAYFVPADAFEDYERMLAQRRSIATRDLPDEKVRALLESRMDERHDHLNALLDTE